MESKQQETIVERWRGALEGLRLRHPNPEVRVALRVEDPTCKCSRCAIDYAEFGQMAQVEIVLDGLPDTDDPTRKMDGFRMMIRSGIFPGVRCAQLAVLGYWLAYVQHETLEMVRGVVGEIHPHSGFGATLECQKLIDGAAGPLDREGIRRLVRSVSGIEAAMLGAFP